MPNRDDFTERIKQLLAKRVGFRCSNPICRVATSGPSDDPTKVVNLGVAAHISAASERGPRFEPNLSADKRRDSSNGIWLCQNCAKLIDSDTSRFSVHLLNSWKYAAEIAAKIELGRNTETSSVSNFQDALSLMPELLMEMTGALKDEKKKLIREFFVLPNQRVMLGRSSKPRLIYYEDNYENLRNKLDILEDYGFIIDVRVGNAQIYRMTPEFIRLLLTDIEIT
jgi:hypothetical protein